MGASLGYSTRYNTNPAGKPISMAYRPGSPDALCIPPNNKRVVFVGDLYPGRIYKIDLSGKVLGYFAHVGKEPGNTGAIHGLACPTENLIYSAEFENWRRIRDWEGAEGWVYH